MPIEIQKPIQIDSSYYLDFASCHIDRGPLGRNSALVTFRKISKSDGKTIGRVSKSYETQALADFCKNFDTWSFLAEEILKQEGITDAVIPANFEDTFNIYTPIQMLPVGNAESIKGNNI